MSEATPPDVGSAAAAASAAPATTAASRRWPRRVLVAALLLFAPVALMGIATSPNESAAIGIQGAVDCDGPLGVLVFALPSLLVYGIGLTVALVDALRAPTLRGRVLLAVCAVVCVLLAGNVVGALREQSSDAHRATCGAT